MKQILITSFGKIKSPAVEELVSYYQHLAGRYIDISRVQKKDVAERKVNNNDLNKTGYLIVLSEKGQAETSEQFAMRLEKLLEQHQQLQFVIGNAWGIADDLLAKADQVMSLSPLTFPHELSLLLLLEQLYRAGTINASGHYHK